MAVTKPQHQRIKIEPRTMKLAINPILKCDHTRSSVFGQKKLSHQIVSKRGLNKDLFSTKDTFLMTNSSRNFQLKKPLNTVEVMNVPSGQDLRPVNISEYDT